MSKELWAFFSDWRAFEASGALSGGVPDYGRANQKRKLDGLRAMRARHAELTTDGWPVEARIDHRLLQAEMNGLEFDLRLRRPWARDPAFYQSVWTAQADTPGHEGPTHHALLELWTFEFPLSPAEQSRLVRGLRRIAPLLAQARSNLEGGARDLWQAGIATMAEQAQALDGLVSRLKGADAGVLRVLDDARAATRSFVDWLEQRAPAVSGVSGAGKAMYSWYLRHVQLSPWDWDGELALLQREQARAHASLRLEEHRNRDLRPLKVIDSAEEYAQRTHQSVSDYMSFLREREIMTVRDDMEPALRAHVGEYMPEENRNFFAIVRQHEPMAIWTHWHHWFEVARAKNNPHPSPVRRGPLLSNIFAGRSEGLTTAMEEMMMHAGLYDRSPRSREVVWIMLAQRAARGLASLHAQANEFTLQQAKDYHVQWTPRGWMSPSLRLLRFEQQLYLRQPGYGSSYVTGKVAVEQLLTDFAALRGADFRLCDFFDAVDAAGIIPVSMLRWQLSGQDHEARTLGLEPMPRP